VFFGHIKTLRIPRMREAKITYTGIFEQRMHYKGVWNIKHGLVHHSLAVGPAAR